MNITPWTIYWLTRLGRISDYAEILAVLSVIALIGVSAAYFCATAAEDDDAVHAFGKAVKIAIPSMLIFGLVHALTPNTKEMAAILVIPRIANSELAGEVGEAAKEMVGLAREWMAELRDEKAKNGDDHIKGNAR